MRLLVLLGCVFTLGWILSWMYYDASTEMAIANPVDSTLLPQAAIDASQLTSRESVGETLNRPGKDKQGLRPASVFDITLEHLRSGEFEAVMAQYPAIQGQLSASDAIEHRKIIIDHAESLIEAGQAVTAYALLDLYLKYEYRDVFALLLMADIYRDADNEMEAIEVLFQAKSYAHSAEDIEQTVKAIRSTEQNYSAQLLARKDYLAQLNLYQRLTELEPEYALHFIGLAEAYLALGNAVDARKALELAQHDAAVADKANDIIRRMENNAQADGNFAAAVSLQALGNQFLVDAWLNNSQAAVLLLDTGASLSIISRRLLEALRIPYQSADRSAWFSTAGGRIRAPVITLDSIALDGVVVENIEVGVIDEFDNQQFDGLLGMNFLRHFEFFIDQNENRLKLSPH